MCRVFDLLFELPAPCVRDDRHEMENVEAKDTGFTEMCPLDRLLFELHAASGKETGFKPLLNMLMVHTPNPDLSSLIIAYCISVSYDCESTVDHRELRLDATVIMPSIVVLRFFPRPGVFTETHPSHMRDTMGFIDAEGREIGFYPGWAKTHMVWSELFLDFGTQGTTHEFFLSHPRSEIRDHWGHSPYLPKPPLSSETVYDRDSELSLFCEDLTETANRRWPLVQGRLFYHANQGPDPSLHHIEMVTDWSKSGMSLEVDSMYPWIFDPTRVLELTFGCHGRGLFRF